MFDHLAVWTTWKQCKQEYRKASVTDMKGLKILGKQIKNFPKCLRDQEVVGSSPVASTKIRYILLGVSYFYLFFSSRAQLAIWRSQEMSEKC